DEADAQRRGFHGSGDHTGRRIDRTVTLMQQTSEFKDIVYAERPERVLKLDVRLPTKGGAKRPPLVMYIPMGGMRGCPKELAPYWLTEHGFTMASIEAR